MSENEEMLDFLGLEEVDELFEDIPERVRTELDLPMSLSEKELILEINNKIEKNKDLNEISSFLGSGYYHHYVPAAVDEIIGKSEFYTSYTPYQAEVSQGMLQALFEYQSIIAELTGLGAVNTSMYDHPTALAEAIMMASRIKRKGGEFLLPKNVHWDFDSIIGNYLRGKNIDIKKVDFNEEGKIDLDDLKEKVNENTLGFYVETPNIFGVLEDDLTVFEDIKNDTDSILVGGIDPVLLTLMKAPSEWGVDIAVGDSQTLGIPPSFGGPTVGVFAAKERYIRKMPGRIIGETEDSNGKRAYCMTLQTREQHIRRERATSNICTNQSLMALASTVFTYVRGGKGLEKLAKENYRRVHDLSKRLNEIEGIKSPYFDGDFYTEFTFECSENSEEIFKRCVEKEVLPGIPLNQKDKFNSLPELFLTAVTEMNTKSEIDHFVNTLEEVIR